MPTRADLLTTANRPISDVIAPDLTVLFCGINPGLYSAWSGHHFARPGNRFWPTLNASGFTPRLFHPSEEQLLLGLGLGITNVAERPSATADELTLAEVVAGGKRLTKRAAKYRPRWLAVLGVTAYRAAFAEPKSAMGLQDRMIGGARVWVLPNPSGLNAHYQRADLARVFTEFRAAVELA